MIGSPRNSGAIAAPVASEQARAEDRPRLEAADAAHRVDPPGEVAQGDRCARHEPADEAAAWLVVAGEQQVDRADQRRREHEPGGLLEEWRRATGRGALAHG